MSVALLISGDRESLGWGLPLLSGHFLVFQLARRVAHRLSSPRPLQGFVDGAETSAACARPPAHSSILETIDCTFQCFAPPPPPKSRSQTPLLPYTRNRNANALLL